MTTITQLFVYTLAVAVSFTVIVFQIVGLARKYRSRAWWIGASAFLLLGVLQVKRFIRLPVRLFNEMLEKHDQTIDPLSLEQYIDMAWVIIVCGLLIWFFDQLRRDLKEFAGV